VRKAAAVAPARKAGAAPVAPSELELKKPLARALPGAAATAVAAARAVPLATAADTDESESLEPGSLLAGPRNVQPYIVKRGEQYMSKEQLEHFRSILNSWKRDLMVEVDRTVSHMKDEAANFPDPNDRATQEEEFSLELRTRDRERKLIRKIDEALKRIEDGSYGYCLETGEEIGIKRLEARPVATLSIEAQERRERRERQYGDRDDRYR
jgi:DnaK suppressor protein